MDYPVRTEGTYAVISLTGEVDMHCSPKARQQILDQLNASLSVLVDLSAVDYIDSSGIASLVEGLRVAKSNQLSFGLVGVSKPALQVLELAKLDKVFPIHETAADAMESS
jgi:anti-sigma B factor antagonist